MGQLSRTVLGQQEGFCGARGRGAAGRTRGQGVPELWPTATVVMGRDVTGSPTRADAADVPQNYPPKCTSSGKGFLNNSLTAINF